MKSLVNRITNWKMTLLGTGVGAMVASIVGYILVTQAHCQFDQIVWVEVLSFAGSAVVGSLGTDNGEAV